MGFSKRIDNTISNKTELNRSVKRRAASLSSGLRSPDTLCRRASHVSVGNLYLSAPSEFSPFFSPRLSRPREAEIRANFHKIKQEIVSPSARLLTEIVCARDAASPVVRRRSCTVPHSLAARSALFGHVWGRFSAYICLFHC